LISGETIMSNQNAAAFRRLHQNSTPLVLPNAWDAASASLFERSGATAIATTSAGVAWTLGYQDGRSLPAEEAISAARRILRVLKVPLSVDIENGYSDDPHTVAQLAQALAELGVAGINIEDGGDDPGLLAAKIEAIRNLLARTGNNLFVNARSDVFLASLVSRNKQVDETIARGRRYWAAGADGLFVPGMFENVDIATVMAQVPLPLNVMAWPGLAGTAELAQLGVRRLSAGAAVSQIAWGVAERSARAFLLTGESEPALQIIAKSFAEMQQLFPAV
jgi:2-methylisocitrate lyase-like PEP mutase family enzyme